MSKKNKVVLVCGGSCSGKSVFSQWFNNATVLELDSFYLAKKDMKQDANGQYNYDEPAAFNIKECAVALESLSQGKEVEIPVYDMRVSDRTGTVKVSPPKNPGFIVLNGIFSFLPEFQALSDFKIYLDVPPELRVARRIIRDVEKGRDIQGTLSWSHVVEKCHNEYVEPMKKHADLVIQHSHNPMHFPI